MQLLTLYAAGNLSRTRKTGRPSKLTKGLSSTSHKAEKLPNWICNFRLRPSPGHWIPRDEILFKNKYLRSGTELVHRKLFTLRILPTMKTLRKPNTKAPAFSV